jgi:glucosamine--fructose-6-phosphate aminotransferase (isomerizing)
VGLEKVFSSWKNLLSQWGTDDNPVSKTSKMLEEVRQQPIALERTLTTGLGSAKVLRQHFETHPPTMILIAARGTSDNAAEFGRYLIEITTGIPTALAAPSVVTLYRSELNLRGAAVVGISQSGQSTDVNSFLEEARKRGAFTVGITNEAESEITKIADHALLVRAGKEQSVAATKTYTGQLITIYLLAHALGGHVEMDELHRIPGYAATAKRYRFMNRSVTVGRGLNYANALELALKMIETSYVLTGRYSAADLMHGPIALLEHSLPAFVFAPPGVTWPSIATVLERLETVKAETMVITDTRNKKIPAKMAHAIQLRWHTEVSGRIADLYTPIPYIIPAQLFAAHLAVVKGLDADRPRSLTKVTRTV